MQELCLDQRNATGDGRCYLFFMENARHEWHLKAWLKELGMSQAALSNGIDMNKAKVSLLVNGKQQYDQEDITAIASFLKISPSELLMHPSEAMAIRRFRAAAEDVADVVSADEFMDIKIDRERGDRNKSDSGRRTGTHG